MIKDQVHAAFLKTTELWDGAVDGMEPRMEPPAPFSRGVPTLAPGVYRPCGPMLEARFELCGRWTIASHGHWLSAADMEALWSDTATAGDPLLYGVKQTQIDGMENWPNEASALFRPERLSLFAGSDYTNEKIYLLWLDFEDEPELWVYDANGESRYKDLEAYLQAYLAEDVGAASISWRA